MQDQFPTEPSLTLFDPLAELLGAGDGWFHYSFDDAVRLSGHACPTVAGAYLMLVRALAALYPDQRPRRGEIRIRMPGGPDLGVNGPISQVFTLVTGAAAENGFQGLAGRFGRKGLLEFDIDAEGPFVFSRTDGDQRVGVSYDPSAIPPHPDTMRLLQKLSAGLAGEDERRRFTQLWRQRVIAILADGGAHTVQVEQLQAGA